MGSLPTTTREQKPPRSYIRGEAPKPLPSPGKEPPLIGCGRLGEAGTAQILYFILSASQIQKIDSTGVSHLRNSQPLIFHSRISYFVVLLHIIK